jgi:predicted dehydrogenase
MSRLRGAIVGFGAVAANGHLPAWLARRDIAITAIFEPVAARRHEALRKLKGVRVYDDLELMLEGERPDFVDIASPPAWHARAAEAALRAGAHVLVEKPLCLSFNEFQSLDAMARSQSRVLACVHNWKYAPAFQLAYQMIADRRLGPVTYLGFERMRQRPAGIDSAQWRLDPAVGGGILIDHGWHVFYLMRWLMGADPSSVSAWIGQPSDRRAEQSVNIRVVFPGERVATAMLSWQASVRRTVTRIYGENGLLEVDGDRAAYVDRAGIGSIIPVNDARDDSYHSAWFVEVARRFEETIRSRGNSADSLDNLAEARVALALIEATRASASQGGIEITIGRGDR